MKTRAKLLNVAIIGVCFAVAFGVFITAQTPAPRPAQQPAAAQTQVVVNVNETAAYWDGRTPFGGFSGKASGVGRLGGAATIESMTQLKSIVLDVGG